MQCDKIIPFYGTTDQSMFAIERRCMDHEGVVIRHLDRILPSGRVLDVGAGDGFIAIRLTRHFRTVIALEPAIRMIVPQRPLPWIRGVAQEIPFQTESLAAAYATWAYYFPNYWNGTVALNELHRVVRRGGLLVIIDNAGNDELCALASPEYPITSDPQWWQDQGFDCTILTTSYQFDTMEEATTLLEFYFGESGRKGAKLEIEFKVAVYTAYSVGAS